MKKATVSVPLKALQKISLFALCSCMAIPLFANTDTTNSNPFNPAIDLLQINDDVLGDPDGLMTKVADKMFLNSIGYQDAFLVVGTYSEKLSNRFNDGDEGDILGLMNTLYPNSQCSGSDCGKGKWLDANEAWGLNENAAAVGHVAQLWKNTLDSDPQAQVWIAEGGQGAFTLDVAKHANNNLGISLATLNSRVHTVQHAEWNIDNSSSGVYGFSNNPAGSGQIGRQGSESWLGSDNQRGELFDYVQVHYIQSGNGNSGLALRNDKEFLADKWEPRLEAPYDAYWETMKESTGKEIDIVDFSDNIITLWIFDEYQSYFNFADTNYTKQERPLAFLARFGQGITNSNSLPTGAFVIPTPTSDLLAGDSINIAVNAQDSDGSVVQVQLSVNDSVISRDSNAPYAWDSAVYPALANLAAGNYALEAIITDNDGGQRSIAQSIAVNEIVVNGPNVKPTGTFVSPTPDPELNVGDSITLSVEAFDSDGVVERAALRINGVKIALDKQPPFVFSSDEYSELANLSAGSFEVRIVLIDDDKGRTPLIRVFTVQ